MSFNNLHLLATAGVATMSLATLIASRAVAQDAAPSVAGQTVGVDTEIAAMDGIEALALDAKYYAEDYGVTEDEALRRLLIMHGTKEQVKAIEAEYGDRISGVYFDNGAEFSLKVTLTGDVVPADGKLVRKAEKDNRKAERKAERAKRKAAGQSAKGKFEINDADIARAEKMVELPTDAKVAFRGKAKASRKQKNQSLEQNAEKLAKGVQGFQGAFFDDISGNMIVRVNRQQASGVSEADLATAASTALDTPVTIQMVDTITSYERTRGGSRLNRDTGALLCTSGFVVKDISTNEVGIATAGHCDVATLKYTDKDGSNYAMTRKKWGMTATYDIAFFVAAPAQPNSPQFYPDSSATPRTLVGWKSVSETEASGIITTGSFLCHYGARTATQSCGEVVNKAYAPGITDGCGKPGAAYLACGPNYVLVEPKAKAGQVNLQCLGGDSGGPWFAYGNA